MTVWRNTRFDLWRRSFQVEEDDYDETFASVAYYTSARSLISIVAEMGWKIHLMDVKTAFLNGIIHEEVYVEKPQGFEIHGRESHVCRLKKAPRAWYSKIDSYLLSMGFSMSEAGPNLYFIMVGDDLLILLLYVDDLFITGEERPIVVCKGDLA